jgi:hypothetical protein
MNEVAIVVQWPKDKRLLVNEVVVIDEDGRPVNLRVIRCELPGMRGRTFASNSPPHALRKAFDRARSGNAEEAGGLKGPNQNAASGLTRPFREV